MITFQRGFFLIEFIYKSFLTYWPVTLAELVKKQSKSATFYVKPLSEARHLE